MAEEPDSVVHIYVFGDKSGGYTTAEGRTVFDTRKIPDYKIYFQPLTDDRVFVEVYDLNGNLLKEGFYTYEQYDEWIKKNDVHLPSSNTFSDKYIQGGSLSGAQEGNTLGKITTKPETPEKEASEADPAIEAETEEEEDAGVSMWDGIQLGLDIGGMIPVVGEIADGANALIYLFRGDYTNAGMSAMAMIPFIGNAATGAKLGTKATNAAAKKTTKATKTTKNGDGAKSEGKKKKDKDKCKIGPYSSLKCPTDFAKHHIIPDYVLRNGTRKNADNAKVIANRSDRISRDFPTLSEGPCICLNNKKTKSIGMSEHREVHVADKAITALGYDNRTPAGTAMLKDTLRISVAAVTALRLECASEILAAITLAFGTENNNMLVRTTQGIPNKATMSVLGTKI